jgi:hypothetical protein
MLVRHRIARFLLGGHKTEKFSSVCARIGSIMRQKLKNILGEERGFLALETREHLGVTQKKMREKLNMGERSYSEAFWQTREVLTA